MTETMRQKGFDDGYDGRDIAHPSKHDYLLGYAQGYEQAEKDSDFTEQRMRQMENEEFRHEHE